MAQFLALIGFAFVSSVTPGPNNILLWASGATFGFRRTVRHVLGTAAGLGGMALVAAAGLGVLVTTVPGLAIGLKVAGSAYLLYLAYRIATSGALEQGTVSRPLGLVQGALFQTLNPKAWIFALGAVTTFRPSELPYLPGSLLVAATMTVIVVPTAAIWALGGGALARFVAGDRQRRVVSLVLGGLLAATVAYVWI